MTQLSIKAICCILVCNILTSNGTFNDWHSRALRDKSVLQSVLNLSNPTNMSGIDSIRDVLLAWRRMQVYEHTQALRPDLATCGCAALAAIGCLHVLLSLGLPLGAMAWGGEQRVLPRPMKWGSLALALLAVVACNCLTSGWDDVPSTANKTQPFGRVRKLHRWAMTGFLTVFGLASGASGSRLERWITAPLFFTAAFAFGILSIA